MKDPEVFLLPGLLVYLSGDELSVDFWKTRKGHSGVPDAVCHRKPDADLEFYVLHYLNRFDQSTEVLDGK